MPYSFRVGNLKGARPEKFGSISSRLYRRWAEPMIAPLHRRIGAEVPIEEGRLLDVGCGPGRLDRLLAAARPALKVVGIDSSRGMIREAGRGPALPNLRFQLAAIEEAPFKNEFDFAIAVLTFHHWEEPLAGLSAVHRGLKPGGRFWIFEGNPDAPSPEIERDRAPLWGWLRIPVAFLRFGMAGHGFRRAEIEEAVTQTIAESPFGQARIVETGSTFRIELTRSA
ncbi:MAG TPA: class I SAM-dependent methyltransferase [Thermoanaerobaculia bacterium]|nr:class I SAM-dependent methyltransferase [Thermoanaerobaculia bacterium]